MTLATKYGRRTVFGRDYDGSFICHAVWTLVDRARIATTPKAVTDHRPDEAPNITASALATIRRTIATHDIQRAYRP